MTRPTSYTYRPGIDVERIDDLEVASAADAAAISALQSNVSALQTANTDESLSGVHDPSVTGLAADLLSEYTRTSEYQPKTLAKLNEIFAPWGATFAHAWRFQESASPAVDMALSGGVSLVQTAGVAFNVSSGITDYETDKAVTFTDNTAMALEPASGADLDVTTGSVFVLMTLKVPAHVASATNSLFAKLKNDYTAIWTVNFGATDGKLDALARAGGVDVALHGAVDHATDAYFDLLWALDRASVSKLMSLTTSLEDVGTADASSLIGSLTGAEKFAFGGATILSLAAGFTMTFAAIGTVPGTLVANRVAALAAYTSARTSPEQVWSKRGAANTDWQKIGP
jgi:hypothetical protein